MMMKKKFVAVALSAVCLLPAVGCRLRSGETGYPNVVNGQSEYNGR